MSERSAGWGLRPRHFLAVLPPELTAPLSTAGSSAAASQLAMGGAPIGLFGDIPAVPSVGGPVASIPEHTFLPVGEVPTLAAAGGLGSLFGGVGSKLVDAATSPGGIASSSAQRLALLGWWRQDGNDSEPH